MKKKDIKNWLKEICRWDNVDDFVHFPIDEGQNDEEGYAAKVRCRIYTRDHVYGIIAIDRQKNNGYLGCVVSTRKPRAGEDWTRGNDLPDGPYTYKTWQKIKNAIIAYELVKIVKKPEYKTDAETQPAVEESSDKT